MEPRPAGAPELRRRELASRGILSLEAQMQLEPREVAADGGQMQVLEDAYAARADIHRRRDRAPAPSALRCAVVGRQRNRTAHVPALTACTACTAPPRGDGRTRHTTRARAASRAR